MIASKLPTFRIAGFRKVWNKALANPSFRLKLILAGSLLLTIAIFMPWFFMHIQLRPGRQINDRLLNLIPAKNMSRYIFFVLYPVLILTFVSLSLQPGLLLKCLLAYCVLLCLRICTLFLIPLEPEHGMVPLQDPFIGHFFYSNTVITKDLFFSGHVSTLFLIFLVNPIPQLRSFFFFSTILLAILILIQHVHYTVDVLAAPLFAWISFKTAGLKFLVPLEKNTPAQDPIT